MSKESDNPFPFTLRQDLGIGDPPPLYNSLSRPELEALILSGQMYLSHENSELRNAGQAIVRLGHEAEHLRDVTESYSNSLQFYRGLTAGLKEKLRELHYEYARYRQAPSSAPFGGPPPSDDPAA